MAQNKFYKNMINSVTNFEQKNKIFQEIFNVIAGELKKRSDNINDLVDQLFLETATWGLDIWEKNLSLTTNKHLSYKDRRKLIRAKFKANYQVSNNMVKSIVDELLETNSQVYFTQEGIIEITINYTGLDLTNKNLAELIGRVKPSFFGYNLRMINSEVIDIAEKQFKLKTKYNLSNRTRTKSRQVSSNVSSLDLLEEYLAIKSKYKLANRAKTRSVLTYIDNKDIRVYEEYKASKFKYKLAGNYVCGR